MLEIEAKMHVAALEPTRRRLRELGASLICKRLETNIFFDTPDRRLRSADSGLRLRRNFDTDNHREQLVLTFKGPRLPGPVKQRPEQELVVASEPDATALLEALGYQRTLQFQKNRESWRLQSCRIELDDLPEIGEFVEVEGPDESEVLRVRELLGLRDQALIRESYPELIAAIRVRRE